MNILEDLKKEGLFLANGKFNSSFTKKFFNTRTPERQAWYNACLGDTLSEKIFIIENAIKEKPTCKICGKAVKFISYREGYREYCSTACSTKGTISIREQTNLKKWGVKYPAQSKEIQKKMKDTTFKKIGIQNVFQDVERVKKGMKDKYGVEHPMLLETTKEKIKITNLARWGVDHPMKNKEIQKKTSNTNLTRYGNICSVQGKKQLEQVRITKATTFYNETILSEERIHIAKPLFSLKEYHGVIEGKNHPIFYPWKCTKCDGVFEDHIANGTLPRCPFCYPPSVQGIEEKELVEWLKSVIPNENIIQNNRRIIPPLEIDIFLPTYKLAIELDEIYWHSELITEGKRGMNYHISKTEDCKKKGITLLHILDIEWQDKKDIIKSIILNKLGIFQNKVGARKCTIQEISSNVSKEFLNKNHIQGYAPASIRLGLFLNNELVSHLAIAKNRFKKGTYEIVRYASKYGYSVQGGLSKLWKEAKKSLPEKFTLISYVDKRLFSGKSNEKIGLSFKGTNRPAYFYTKDHKQLLNRMKFQKKNLNKELEIFDPTLTEWENMKVNGYDRIWDCGTDVWELEV